MKTCRKCLVQKSLDDFSRQTANVDGLQSNCKSCSSAIRREWRAARSAKHPIEPKCDSSSRDRVITKSGDEILIDEADYELVNRYTWHTRKGYAITTAPHPSRVGKTFSMSMHRLIMGLAVGDLEQVDHINGVRSDNRRSNLRVCSNTENSRNRRKQKNNTSGFKGVYWHPINKKWHAKIRVDKKLIHIGAFDDPKMAHEAYQAAAAEKHGEFRNFG